MHKNSNRPEKPIKIRKSIESDKREIENIHTKAFGEKKGPEIAELVKGLFNDKTAMPLFSLVAIEGDKIVGHILCTKVKIIQTMEPVSAQILAPLAILPTFKTRALELNLLKKD